MRKLMALAAVVAVAGLSLVSAPRAADETTLMDNLVGQSAPFVSALRDTFGKTYLTFSVTDISTASNATTVTGAGPSGHVIAPVAGKITAIYTVLVASTGSEVTLDGNAPTLLVPFIGGTEVTGGTVTLASGFADTAANGGAGNHQDTDSATPSGANTVAQGDVIELQSNGNTTTDFNVYVTLEIDRDS